MVTRSLRVALAACTLLFATVIAGDAGAGTISSLRVKLSPLAAPRGTLPDAVRTHLESVLGTSFDVAKVTRTGALDLAFSPALDARDAASAVAALRNDRMVLWAEMPSRLPSTTPALRPKSATPETSRKFMVRLKDDQADIAPLLADLSLRIGVPIAVDRQIGPVWVLTVLQSRSVDTLDALAEVIQQHPQVEYADAVHRLTIKRVPNDPLYPAQWNLTDALAGIDLPAAWDLETGSPNIIVGVVDTGIRSHPDNIGRILPGYDFISDKDSARDGDGRDPDATDEGDWTEDGECFGAPAEASSWHGTFVAGLIAANANNGIGIAGVDWNAKVVPARALGRCGGLLDDVYAAVRWVAGLPVDNVPPNSYPAKVINMSLGGEHGC
ncbi:MAG TPA: S8 family serine peptidase, partial [Casimicrobiaceae bacterium]|nr:S8 family serine peptidase [Casimicrobiaceae bacterium]